MIVKALRHGDCTVSRRTSSVPIRMLIAVSQPGSVGDPWHGVRLADVTTFTSLDRICTPRAIHGDCIAMMEC